MLRTLRLVLTLGTLAALVMSCAPKAPEQTPEEATLVHAGDRAPTFTVTSLAGDTITVGGEQGEIVVLSFFATWCPPCREEFPHLETEVWQRFRGEKFSFVAIGREHTADELQPFVEEMAVSFPIAPDPTREVYAKYAEAFIPRTIVIGPDGAVLYHAADYDPEGFHAMVELIDAELGKIRSAEPVTEPVSAG